MVYEDIDQVIRADGLRIVFVARRTADDHDLFQSRRDSLDEPFETPSPIVAADSPFNDNSVTVSSDLTTLLFRSNRSGTEQLYEATRIDN